MVIGKIWFLILFMIEKMKALSQIKMLDHSEAKVKLFGDYIQKYLNIICNDGYTKEIHLFDLFSGPGVYENGGEGSPIIALRKIKNTFFQFINDRPVNKTKINCFFNDLDKGRIDSLKQNIKDKNLYYSSYGKLEFSSSDYLDVIKTLPNEFKKYKNEKAFVFIDPFGYKEIKASHIAHLLDCAKKSEVLLWLPIQFMYRFSNAGTPDVLKNFNKELGIIGQTGKLQNEWEYINALKKGFQNYLGIDYFVDNFTLKKDENTVFCLFFFSSHIRGFEKMLETKWAIDSEQGRGWEYSGNQPTLFSSQKTNKLAELLEDYIRSEAKTNGQIFEFTLRNGFLPTHCTQILKDFQSNESIDVKDLSGNKVRKGAFYINYDNYKKSPHKITLKLK